MFLSVSCGCFIINKRTGRCAPCPLDLCYSINLRPPFSALRASTWSAALISACGLYFWLFGPQLNPRFLPALCALQYAPGPCMEAHESQHVNEDSCVFLMQAGGTPLRLGNVNPNSTRLEAIEFFPHTMSTTDSSYQMAWSHLQWWSFAAHRLLAVSSVVCKRRLKLFGHVARLTDDVPANLILQTYCECQDNARPSPDWRRVREVDLPPPGFNRSAGTREYRWPKHWSWQETDRFGGKSQQRDATAECYASRWWWICAAALMMRSHVDDVYMTSQQIVCFVNSLQISTECPCTIRYDR